MDKSYEVIETIKLNKYFKDFWGRVKVKAVENLNLKVFSGEIFGLLGPNGSGKTTTIKLILGLLFPTKGKIRVFSDSPRKVKNKMKIGFLPEESYLYPYQNAEEALYFYGRLFGYPRDICRKRVDELLEMVGLSKVRKRLLKEYSKGMARRIGIAQALINDPELIILDEPTTGLDPIGTKEIKDLILQLKQHGKTILLCSHLLADVENLCDRITILFGGRTLIEGKVEDVLRQESDVQLLIKNYSPELIEKLEEIIKKEGFRNVEIANPKEKLENFFLKAIEEARAKSLPSFGADRGKKLENFFTNTPDKKNILDDLTKKPDKNIIKKNQEKFEDEKDDKKNNILDNLVKDKKEDIDTKQKKQEIQEKQEKPKLKRDVLDKLLATEEDKKQ